MPTAVVVTGAVLLGVVLLAGVIAYLMLHDVQAGAIRLVTWPQGSTRIYRGPAKSKELFALTTGVTISRRLIQVAIDLTDQTADVDRTGHPRPVEVHVQATALVSVGDSDGLIRNAAQRFFTLAESQQTEAVTDLVASGCREALHRLVHDQLFATADAPLVVTTRQCCEQRLADLGLVLQSLSILSVQSALVESRRRQATAEAQADAQVVVAAQARRGREAELEAERLISEKERELAQTRARNSSLIAEATARQQEIQAKADAERIRIEAEAAQQALRGAQFGLALDEALRITKIAATQAEGFRKVNDAIRDGEDSFFRYRLIEMLPQLTPRIAEELANARLVSASNTESQATTNGISSVLQAAIAQQLKGNGAPPRLPEPKRSRRVRARTQP